MEDLRPNEDHPVSRQDLLLWFGMLAPPITWGLHFQVSYMLAPSACAARQSWYLHAATLGALLIVALAGLAAWRSWQRLPGPESEDATSRVGGRRFLAISGVALAVFFAMVIVAIDIPSLILRVCD